MDFVVLHERNLAKQLCVRRCWKEHEVCSYQAAICLSCNVQTDLQLPCPIHRLYLTSRDSQKQLYCSGTWVRSSPWYLVCSSSWWAVSLLGACCRLGNVAMGNKRAPRAAVMWGLQEVSMACYLCPVLGPKIPPDAATELEAYFFVECMQWLASCKHWMKSLAVHLELFSKVFGNCPQRVFLARWFYGKVREQCLHFFGEIPWGKSR